MFWKKVLQNGLTIVFVTLFVLILTFGILRVRKQSINNEVQPVVSSRNATQNSTRTPNNTTQNQTLGNTANTSGNAVTKNATSTLPVNNNGVVDGDAYRTPWGNVELEIRIENGKIADVTALDYPQSPPSIYAKSDLISQAISAQSADIQGVSGATYTSLAFAKSLESAISKAGSMLK